MTSLPDYSIVVPAYDEEDFLGDTLCAIQEAMCGVADLVGELIVVDNASTDRTAEIARSHGAIVRFEAHRQIARARNAGAEVARGRWLVFVDADTRISARLLSQCLELLREGRCAGGGTLIDTRHPYLALRLAIRFWNLLSKTLRWACGAFVFCRADAFRDVGGFDEVLYASEEIRLSNELRRWGRGRGMRVCILNETIHTSARKLDWYGPLGIARLLFRIVLMRGGLRDVDACRLWYSRPTSPRASVRGAGD